MGMMLVGDPRSFAVESLITAAYASRGLRALGCFLIHVGGNRYGVYKSDATLLANSFDEVENRIARRGVHTAPFAGELEPGKIADAFRGGIYNDHPKDQYFGLPLEQFRHLIYAHGLVWAPDGDEAFDDGSYILQFDVGDRVRLVAFKCSEGWLHDPLTLRDVWIPADRYYQILCEWREAFETEWTSLSRMEP